MSRFSVEAVFKAVDQMSAPVSRMQSRVTRFTRSLDRNLQGVNRGFGSVDRGIKRAGLAAVAGFGAVSAAGANVVKTGMDFEQTIVNAAAKFPGEIKKGTEAFKVLEDAARSVGRTTEFTASQSAEAINYLAMAGFTAEGSVAALPLVVDLATAASLDLARASDIATDSLGAFGLTSEDAITQTANLARVSDVLAKTANSANTDVSQLFESMKKSGPIATAAGASIETVASMIAIMANSGIKAELAGTATSNAFLNLVKPVGEAAKTIDRLGLKVRETNGDLRDIPDIIDDLNKATSGMAKADRLEALAGIFGREGLAGIANMVAKGGQGMRDYRKTLQDAGGETKRVATTMRDTLSAEFKSLDSAVESVKLSTFQLVKGPISDAVKRMTEWTRANEEFIASKIGEYFNYIVENFDKIVTGLKRVLKAVVAFYVLYAALKAVSVILAVVNGLMWLNPVALMALGVLALVAALGALWIWIDDVAASFDNLNPAVRLALAPIELLIKAVKWIKDNIGEIGTIASDAFDVISLPVRLLYDYIKFVVDNISKLGDAATAAKNAVFGNRPDVDAGEINQSRSGAAAAKRNEMQIVSPSDRVARSIEESREHSSAEVTIIDETKRAKVTRGRMGNALRLQQSGGL